MLVFLQTTRSTSALSALGQDVNEDGGTRKAKTKNRFLFPLGGRRLQASSTLEAEQEKIELESISDVTKLAQEPYVLSNKRYDIVGSVLKGKWQEENQTLDNLPAWDPISALHAAAGDSMIILISGVVV